MERRGEGGKKRIGFSPSSSPPLSRSPLSSPYPIGQRRLTLTLSPLPTPLPPSNRLAPAGAKSGQISARRTGRVTGSLRQALE